MLAGKLRVPASSSTNIAINWKKSQFSDKMSSVFHLTQNWTLNILWKKLAICMLKSALNYTNIVYSYFFVPGDTKLGPDFSPLFGHFLLQVVAGSKVVSFFTKLDLKKHQ